MKANQAMARGQAPELQPSVDDGVLGVIMEIGRERAKIAMAMKDAFLRDDEDEALERARELTGFPSKRANIFRSERRSH